MKNVLEIDSDEPAFDGGRCCRRAIGHTYLVENILYVSLHSVLAHVEGECHFLVRHSADDHSQDVCFGRRQVFLS